MHRSSVSMALAWGFGAALTAIMCTGWGKLIAVVPAACAAGYLIRASVIGPLVVAAALVVALSLATGPAFAADGAPGLAGSLFADVRGILESVLGVVAAAIVGLLAWAARQAFGVTIDTKMRAALQGAIENGIHLGLDAVQGLANRSTFSVRNEVLATAMGYVRRYAPDALAHFGLGEEEIQELVRAQLAKIMPDGALLGAVVAARPAGAAAAAGATGAAGA